MTLVGARLKASVQFSLSRGMYQKEALARGATKMASQETATHQN